MNSEFLEIVTKDEEKIFLDRLELYFIDFKKEIDSKLDELNKEKVSFGRKAEKIFLCEKEKNNRKVLARLIFEEEIKNQKLIEKDDFEKFIKLFDDELELLGYLTFIWNKYPIYQFEEFFYLKEVELKIRIIENKGISFNLEKTILKLIEGIEISERKKSYVYLEDLYKNLILLCKIDTNKYCNLEEKYTKKLNSMNKNIIFKILKIINKIKR